MSSHSVIVDAAPQHDEGIVAVGMAHEFAGADTAVDARYRRFVASHGRLVVALDDDRVVGFGGAVDVDDVRLLTDLFLLADHQGRGHGGAMLRALVGGSAKRMTFSSRHERALPTYRTMGMHPQWTLQYWSGRAPKAAAVHRVAEVACEQWQGDRHDLAEFWSAGGGRLIHLHQGDRLAGWSIVTPPGPGAATWTIARLSTDLPHDQALVDVMSIIPAGAPLLVCTPDRSSAGKLLETLGFAVVDRDVCCATDGVDVPARVAALHPGLG